MIFGDSRLPDRIWAKLSVHELTGCWLWNGGLFEERGGYSQIWFNKNWRGHRLFYSIFISSIPDDLVLDHLCRTPRCVNPEHLEPVTISVNVRRGLSGELKIYDKCINQHEASTINTGVRKDGRKYCKVCRKINEQKRRTRIKNDQKP